jgi:hypothetical protein
MTYIDKQFSGGEAFFKSGFRKHSETPPNYYLVNKKTFERSPAKEIEEFDTKKVELHHNEGNLKLVYTCGE